MPCRDATPEEVEMEAEVEGLRKQLEELTTATPDETDTISDLKKELDEKERALYTLQVRTDLGGLWVRGSAHSTHCRCDLTDGVWLAVFV
jgi:hypothetical protein